MSDPQHEYELVDNWGEPDSVWLGYEVDVDDGGWEGDPSAGPSYWRQLGRSFSAWITHYHDGKQWLPIEGEWWLYSHDYSEASEVQDYARVVVPVE